MPYVDEINRKYFTKLLDQFTTINGKGNLEYCIYKLMVIFMRDKEYNYTNLHDAVYAAQHCADEFKRRHLDKREDQALAKNGDIT